MVKLPQPSELRARMAKARSKKQLATKQYVKSQISRGQEKKYQQYQTTAAAIDPSTGLVQCVSNNIAQGTGENQRIGDKITPKKLRLMYALEGADDYNLVRVLVVQWRQTTASGAPTLSEVLTDNNSVYAPLGFYDEDHIPSQCKVLYDKLHMLNGSTSSPIQAKVVRKTISKFKGKKIDFEAGSTNVGNNHIYVLMISDSTAIAHPSVTLNARFEYTDS